MDFKWIERTLKLYIMKWRDKQMKHLYLHIIVRSVEIVLVHEALGMRGEMKECRNLNVDK